MLYKTIITYVPTAHLAEFYYHRDGEIALSEYFVFRKASKYTTKNNFAYKRLSDIRLVMRYNPNAIMVIKSTIPVGYTAHIREKTGSKNIANQ